MYYALVDIVAVLVIFVINFNVIFPMHKPRNVKAYKLYRWFLLSLLFYFVTDGIWGIFDSVHSQIGIIVDTSIYFASMSLSILIWTHFEVAYLNEDGLFGKIIRIVGWVIFSAGIILLVLNLCIPSFTLLFSADENGIYKAGIGRYIFFAVQMALFILSSIYALVVALQNAGDKRTRYICISAVGVAMTIAIALQLPFTNAPIYSAGCLIGCCLLYTFVIRQETNEYKRAIEEGKYREAKTHEELDTTKALAYSDPLTGVKNKHAYVELEEHVDLLIREGKMDKFSIIVFDLNDLKGINDTYGHAVGDKYIIRTCEKIGEFFKNDVIYRFGGDEFVLVLQGDSYAKRYKVLEKFNAMVEGCLGTDEPIIATGIADFNLGKDNTLRAVFVRADQKMYMRKHSLKEMSNA